MKAHANAQNSFIKLIVFSKKYSFGGLFKNFARELTRV